ncbi:hypothetical protein NC651_011582 [Populus alba x Populus x berolinensis]|nr:hypothetical protein NC651_011582 [Populus alba x Populus x berolinensis]
MFNRHSLIQLTRDFNRLDFRFLDLFFRHSHGKNSIFHRSLDLIHFCILRQPEPPQELATASLHTLPCIFLVFLLHIPFSANLKHSVIFDFDLHFLFFKPRKICLEYMGFWGLFPINAGVDKG